MIAGGARAVLLNYMGNLLKLPHTMLLGRIRTTNAALTQPAGPPLPVQPDSEEVLFDAQRPVILNGIEELTSREDLRDRSIILTLRPIPDAKRRDEATLWDDVRTTVPLILGALLDAVAVAMGRVSSVQLAAYPRMADFARWVTAAEPGLGQPQGAFLAAYTGNRADAIETNIEYNPVARAIRALAAAGSWAGTATELYETLNGRESEGIRRAKSWPQGARGMSGALRRAAPDLRALGVEVEHYRDSTPNRTRLIRIRESGLSSVRTVQTNFVFQTPECGLPAGLEREVPDVSDGPDGEKGALA